MLKQKKSGDKLETQLLRTDDKYREQYQQRIANQLNDIDALDQLEDRYDRFVSSLTTSAQEILPKVYVKPKQKWMAKDILEKMDTRRKAKPNTDVYKQLDEEIKSECHTTKERILIEQCDLIALWNPHTRFTRRMLSFVRLLEEGTMQELSHALKTEMGTSLWNRKDFRMMA